jgi:catechol 2,3-dioxygenase-like lactoylglutathione lyase family enzyme
MRLLSIALIATLALVMAPPAEAQLAPPNAAGVTYGHVHLSVPDPDVHRKLWADQFGAVIGGKGTLIVAKIPNMLVAFRKAEPTGPSQGTAMDHFGLKVRNLAETLAKWRAAGYTVEREFKGSEGFLNAFLTGPDNLRFELQEDTKLPTPVAGYHLHFRVPDPVKLRDWYVQTFSLTPGKSGANEIAEAPGMRLVFQTSPTPPKGGTRGTAVDHIGFEITNLEAFVKKLEASGIKMDVAYRQIPDIGLNIAYLTDPSGVYIEVTEGYNKY